MLNNIDKKLEAIGNNEETKRLADLKKKELAKNDSDIDLGIAIDQAFDEAVKNGFKGSKIDFIKSAPIKLLRTFLAKGGPVKEIDDNSLQQLIDDYLDDIRTMKDGKKMSLTDYIKENGGVKSE